MSSLSNNLAKMAYKILTREGQSATLVQPKKSNEGTYDPETGEFTAAAPDTCTVKVVLLDYELTSSGNSTQTGTIIEATDKQCYMTGKDTSNAALPAAVSASSDYLTVGGVDWSIVTIKEHNPSGSQPIMYVLQLRK